MQGGFLARARVLFWSRIRELWADCRLVGRGLGRPHDFRKVGLDSFHWISRTTEDLSLFWHRDPPHSVASIAAAESVHLDSHVCAFRQNRRGQVNLNVLNGV